MSNKFFDIPEAEVTEVPKRKKLKLKSTDITQPLSNRLLDKINDGKKPVSDVILNNLIEMAVDNNIRAIDLLLKVITQYEKQNVNVSIDNSTNANFDNLIQRAKEIAKNRIK
jgi:hypothetical protein